MSQRPITRDLIREWKTHPVTESLFEAVNERIDAAVERVVTSSDPDFDRFAKGMIHAYREILSVEVIETTTGEENDEI